MSWWDQPVKLKFWQWIATLIAVIVISKIVGEIRYFNDSLLFSKFRSCAEQAYTLEVHRDPNIPAANRPIFPITMQVKYKDGKLTWLSCTHTWDEWEMLEELSGQSDG